MIQGGPAIHYLKRMWNDQKSAVFLTGYQVKGTNGRHLLEEGYVSIDGWRTNVKCEVQKFDFSGHADIEDIKKAIWAVNPKRLIVQHGDEESVANVVAWAKEQTPFEVYGPGIGDTIDL
jgi:putative mRNA 3-end processing factor